MNLFLDLDGPILNTAERNFRVYRAIVQEMGGQTAILQDAFWDMKRSGNSSAQILRREAGTAGIHADSFARRWLSEIEKPAWLAFDCIQPGVLDWIFGMASQFQLILVTLRQNGTALRDQLALLKLERLFKAVLCDTPTTGKGWETKYRLVTESGIATDGVIMGDTEVDVRAGKLLGLGTIAVSCGIRTRDLLAAEEPELIVDSLVELHATTIIGKAPKPCKI